MTLVVEGDVKQQINLRVLYLMFRVLQLILTCYDYFINFQAVECYDYFLGCCDLSVGC